MGNVGKNNEWNKDVSCLVLFSIIYLFIFDKVVSREQCSFKGSLIKNVLFTLYNCGI